MSSSICCLLSVKLIIFYNLDKKSKFTFKKIKLKIYIYCTSYVFWVGWRDWSAYVVVLKVFSLVVVPVMAEMANNQLLFF